MQSSEPLIQQMEPVLQPYLAKADLPDSYTEYISNMIIEDPPRSGEDLFHMIGDFFLNDINQTQKNVEVICSEIFNTLSDKKLISQDGNNVWVAERMDTPLLMNDVELISEKEQADGYAETPFTYEKFKFTLNEYLDDQGTDTDREEARKKLEEKKQKEEAKKK